MKLKKVKDVNILCLYLHSGRRRECEGLVVAKYQIAMLTLPFPRLKRKRRKMRQRAK